MFPKALPQWIHPHALAWCLGPMLLFLAIGLVFGFLHGFILGITGLLKFA